MRSNLDLITNEEREICGDAWLPMSVDRAYDGDRFLPILLMVGGKINPVKASTFI
jgi:hypothetical protein